MIWLSSVTTSAKCLAHTRRIYAKEFSVSKCFHYVHCMVNRECVFSVPSCCGKRREKHQMGNEKKTVVPEVKTMMRWLYKFIGTLLCASHADTCDMQKLFSFITMEWSILVWSSSVHKVSLHRLNRYGFRKQFLSHEFRVHFRCHSRISTKLCWMHFRQKLIN